MSFISIIKTNLDTRIESFNQKIAMQGCTNLKVVQLEDVYAIDKKFSRENLVEIKNILTNEVFEQGAIDSFQIPQNYDFCMRISFLAGVTDNLSKTVAESISDGLNVQFIDNENVYSSQIFYCQGEWEIMEKIAKNFANSLIQKIDICAKVDDLNINIPQVKLQNNAQTLEISLDEMTEKELLELGKKGIKDLQGNFRGPLALKLSYLQAIKDYFSQEKRNPTDIELESIAQLWSEHCRHTIFANPLDEVSGGIYKYYIRRATEEIRQEKGASDFCVSVFSDNAGGIIFDKDFIVCDKMETHNSPSALDPYGGAMTGIVGVNRDVLGFGKGAKAVLNRYGFCVANPKFSQEKNSTLQNYKNDDGEFELFRGKNKSNQILSPQIILDGVVKGIEDGGNESGIPAPQGFVYYDDSFAGKPLVFAGTVGILPRKISQENSWEKSAQAGDCIVMVGGAIGLDGIHGATMSSESLDDGSPATAVQIGDPITQKKMSDTIIRELRDEGFINSVHDCGAGGISGTVTELGFESGGFEVNLEQAPLKYPNMSPWEIWISESQERMVFSIAPDKADEFCQKLKARGVVATIIGKFTDSGRGEIFFHGKKVYDLSLDFLETWPREQQNSCEIAEQDIYKFSRENSSKNFFTANQQSFSWISERYDHTVQAGMVVGPLQGAGKINGSACVYRPVLTSEKAIVTSQALNPHLTDVNSYQMATQTITDAIGEAVAVGGNVDYMALMDNFCWCSSDEGERLFQLKKSAQGCYDGAVNYGTPFISGKDSMFNDFKGYDKNNEEVKISALPTLLVSALGVIDDFFKVQTLDFKLANDEIFIVKLSADLKKNKVIFQQIFQAHQTEILHSSQYFKLNGFQSAVGKSSLAGKLGCKISQENFSDAGFLISLPVENIEQLQTICPTAEKIGVVQDDQEVDFNGEKISQENLQKQYFDKK